jgi:hypothetical protein
MRLFIIKFQINKSFADWEAGFVRHEAARKALGIEVEFRGQLVSDDRVIVGLKAESQTVLDELMQRDAAEIEATGHILDSTEMDVVELSQ